MVDWLGWLVNVYPSHKNEPSFQAAISSPPKEDLPAATEVVAESEAAA